MNFVVEELTDSAAIAVFLEKLRLWTAYALCDLDEPYRRHSRFLGASADGRVVAVVLVYTPPGFSGMLPFGLTGGVAAIFSTSHDLPSRSFLLVGEEHREAVERHYRLDHPCAMFRMAVNRSSFMPTATNLQVRRLSAADIPAIEALYRAASESGSAFLDPTTMSHGMFFGAFDDGVLVAVAGTHAWSSRFLIGAIGGVFTHPDWRCRGLATATTAAVTQTLMTAGVQDVVLKVRADNEPALRAYARLGFTVVRPYLEGEAVERAG
jgi:ribosomal protein S18 acetylase RimI-like enzyme